MKETLLLIFFFLGVSFQPYAQELFIENFEDSNFSERGWYDNTGFVLTDKEHIEGSVNSAEFYFKQGEELPVSGGTHRILFTPTDEVSVSYYVKYSAEYTGSNNPYHPHEFYLITTVDGNQIGPAYTHLTTYIEQNEGIPLIAIQDGMNVDSLNIGVDLTHITENRSVAGCNGDTDGYGHGSCYEYGGIHRNSKEWRADRVYFTDTVGVYYKNQWHHIDVYVKLNSIIDGKGVVDGIIKYWYDGELLVDHHDVLFRTGQHSDMQYEQLLIGPYIGGGSPINQTFWIDDLKISTTKPNFDAIDRFRSNAKSNN
jgi:hypothetical protein